VQPYGSGAEKEGRKAPEPEQKPMAQWSPTKEGYLKFLVESQAVYFAMEEIVASGESPIYPAFVDTGKGGGDDNVSLSFSFHTKYFIYFTKVPRPPFLRAEEREREIKRPSGAGLERAAPLAKDIAWFTETHGLEAPVADGRVGAFHHVVISQSKHMQWQP
jgi:hypothetical protein